MFYATLKTRRRRAIARAGMKKKIIIVGPGTPPIIGPSIATKIIISSRLSREFDLIHFDSNVHRSLDSL